MNLPRRRRSRPRGQARLALTGDFPVTDQDITEALPRADWDGRTYEFTGASDIGTMPAPVPDTEPITRLRAQPRYQPTEPPPAGYADTTGPMPALGRPAVSIGDALTHDAQWGPKLAPLPCGHCGTYPAIPDGILDRTRIIGHVNWLARQAGWAYDADLTLTCPDCQQDDEWKARQGQVEVRWPAGSCCYRHDVNNPDADCTCPGAVLAVDVMLASEDHLGRHQAAAS